MTTLIYKNGFLDFATPEEMRILKGNAKVNSVSPPDAGQRLMGFFCSRCKERLDIDDIFTHRCLKKSGTDE